MTAPVDDLKTRWVGRYGLACGMGTVPAVRVASLAHARSLTQAGYNNLKSRGEHMRCGFGRGVEVVDVVEQANRDGTQYDTYSFVLRLCDTDAFVVVRGNSKFFLREFPAAQVELWSNNPRMVPWCAKTNREVLVGQLVEFVPFDMRRLDNDGDFRWEAYVKVECLNDIALCLNDRSLFFAAPVVLLEANQMSVEMWRYHTLHPELGPVSCQTAFMVPTAVSV